jgi:DNA-binding NarL/FixJ family response regulator
MTKNKRIRIFFVDDHPVVHWGLLAMFEDFPQIEVAGRSFNAETVMQEILELKPDVVLVDWRLAGQDGACLCRQLKALESPPRVLILTSFGDESNVIASVGAGADGFVLKTSQDDVLVAAITTVAAGGTVWPVSAASSFRERLVSGGSVKPKSPLDQLSPRERRVLALIAVGKTNKEIALEFGVSEKTVRNQASSLMQKLGVDRRAHAAAMFVKYQE